MGLRVTIRSALDVLRTAVRKMSVSTTVVSPRRAAPSSSFSPTAAFRRSSLRRSISSGVAVMPAVEGGMIRNGIAVKTGEQAQRDAVADAFCQLPVVPLLDPHQNPGPQDLPASQSASYG